MIRLENVTLRLGGFRLERISLEVGPGGYGLVIGPTGSGKTSLLEAVAGHVPLEGGRIFLDGRDVSQEPPETRHVGMVYQSYHLFPHRSVRENITYGLENAETTRRRLDRHGRAEELAELLGITGLLDRPIQGLSGGEQQRVALARALAPRPRILLLDEPFAAVDPALRRVLRRELQQIREREGVTILHVTHDVEDALRLGDVVVVLADGGVAQSGPPEMVFRYPNSTFVANFLGSGTVLKGTITPAGEPDGIPPRFPARFTSGALTLDVIAERAGEAHAVIRPEDLLLGISPGEVPRNRFEGVVRRVERLGPIVHVQVEIAGETLVAAVTSATADQLGLRTGTRIATGLKATAVHLL
jgi:molybdopterin-binding protein